MKSAIIERLGQDDILLPALIQAGLAANDRVKIRLSVLQAAAARADAPQAGRFQLAAECRAAGLDPLAMETLVQRAGALPGKRITAPGLAALGDAIWDDIDIMARAVAAGDAATGDTLRRRLTALRDALASGPGGGNDSGNGGGNDGGATGDVIERGRIARMTGLGHGGDSPHRLVMDLHKALNRLSAAHAEEVLDGAHVYGLRPEDRPAVAAFMRGLDATRRLKFGHPGLGTTAARGGDRLTIQNDIGETDAHVVVITVEDAGITVTYTDVHPARAKFFTRLFRDFPARWSGLDDPDAATPETQPPETPPSETRAVERLNDGDVFHLVTGHCPTPGPDARDAFLAALGAALVFLIDWNKARKLLRTWVSKSDAVAILDWAAEQRVGHRGFLELGGADLVAAAVRSAAATRIGFGERLDGVLGREQAVDFLKTVLRVSAETLLDGSSVRLARDRIEADLVRRLQRVDAALLAIVIRQAGLAREIAAGLTRFVADRRAGRPADAAVLAARARLIEEKADRIAVEARGEILRFDADPLIERMVNRVEDAIDELEQAAFIASLAPAALAPALLAPLADLCAAAVTGAEAAAAGLAAAAEVPEGQRLDSEDALAAVGRLVEAEHVGDAAERTVTAAILGGDFDLKTALSVLDLARTLERTTDRLADFGHVLREHVLADLSR